MSPLFGIWTRMPNTLFSWREDKLEPLTEKQQEFVRVMELADVQKHIRPYRWLIGMNVVYAVEPHTQATNRNSALLKNIASFKPFFRFISTLHKGFFDVLGLTPFWRKVFYLALFRVIW